MFVVVGTKKRIVQRMDTTPGPAPPRAKRRASALQDGGASGSAFGRKRLADIAGKKTSPGFQISKIFLEIVTSRLLMQLSWPKELGSIGGVITFFVSQELAKEHHNNCKAPTRSGELGKENGCLGKVREKEQLLYPRDPDVKRKENSSVLTIRAAQLSFLVVLCRYLFPPTANAQLISDPCSTF